MHCGTNKNRRELFHGFFLSGFFCWVTSGDTAGKLSYFLRATVVGFSDVYTGVIRLYTHFGRINKMWQMYGNFKGFPLK